MGQKVTFYNEISIQKPVGDIKVPGNSSSLSSNGIYFSPANDILQNQPPHIVQGQYIYTLGSHVINNTPEKPEERSIVSVINQNNTIEFKTKTDNDSLFVSDIESNQFDKTITIKKSAIDLSGITTPLKNIVNSIKGTDCSIIVNDTTIRLYWDDKEGLILSDSTLEANNILIINNYKTNTNLTQPSDNIVKIFAYTPLSVSLPDAYSNYLIVEDLTTNLEPGYKYGKVIKLIKPWSDNYDNTYTFSGFNISAEKTDTYTSANKNDYSFKLSKIISPFEFNKSNNKFDVNNSPFSLSSVTTGAKGEVNYAYESSYNVRVGSGYCEVSNVNKHISVTDAYYISNDSYVKIKVTDNTKEDDIYYITNKTYTLELTGAKQWGLVFNYNGASIYDVTENAYYNKTFTFPADPTREGYTFDGWYTAQTNGNNVTGVKAGSSSYTWHETNYNITLYAHWTQNVKYYWYVGQENPASMTSISPIVTDNTSPGWRYIGTSKPTSSTFTSTNMLWNGDTNNISFGSRIISYIAIPYKPLQMWDVTGGDGLFYTIQNNGNPVNINGVDYYVYMSDYKTAAFTMNIYNK